MRSPATTTVARGGELALKLEHAVAAIAAVPNSTRYWLGTGPASAVVPAGERSRGRGELALEVEHAVAIIVRSALGGRQSAAQKRLRRTIRTSRVAVCYVGSK